MEPDFKPTLVSIITPAYNSAAFIGDTIRSVQNQTYNNWEHLIVIDQGTTDDTANIVRSFMNKDPRIRLIEIKNQKGISLSRNKAIQSSQGEWLAFLDSDDLWLPDKLKLQIAFMQKTKANFSCTGYRKISEDGKITGRLRQPPEKQSYQSLLLNNLISCPTVMYNQKVLGQFFLKEHAHEDYLLWLDIIKKSKICFGLPEDLARYRVVENSRSMNVNRSGSRWVVYRKFENLNFLSSCYYFTRYAITAVGKRLFF